MKLEWYNYGPARKGLSGAMLRKRLPDSLRDRLLSKYGLDYGVAADPADHGLVAELDRFFRIGKTREVIRDLRAEADYRSLGMYEFYVVGAQSMSYRGRTGSDQKASWTLHEYVHAAEYDWPGLRVGVRELGVSLDLPFDRIIILSDETKAIFEAVAVSGVQYTRLPDGLWWMRVLPRVPCRADAIVAPDYEAATHSVAGPYLFGLRYEPEDFGDEDLQLIDRIELPAGGYRYRMPWLIASRRFVALCAEHKVDRLLSPRGVFGRGMVPVLVGRGAITSTIVR